jgi:hypothetical protein
LSENPQTAPSATPVTTLGTGAVGNPKDIQGIIALGVVGGAFAIAGVAIATGTAAASVLASVLPLASVVVGYYFGMKSQQ